MSIRWYVLRCKPRKEQLVAEQLDLRKVETFAPHIRVQVVNPRARRMRPYFPGYVFIHVDMEKDGQSLYQYVPGTTGVVSFGGEPALVPDGLIQAIRRRVEEVNAAGGELFDALKAGDTVIVQDGPFAGYEAIFDVRLPGTERVRVLLKLLQRRQVPLDLPAGQIKPKK
jgi:transcriptional antiterminator RfaH